MMSNKTYDILKWIAMILLPAIGTAYFGLAGIWGLPYAEQIVGTITVIDTFLGVVLGISNSSYKETLRGDDILFEINKDEFEGDEDDGK